MGQMVSALMAIAMAGIGTFSLWKLWQLMREPSVRLQSLQLKLKGALRPAGYGFVSLASVYLAGGVWGMVVNYHANAAAIEDDRVHTPQNVVFAPGYAPVAADVAQADRAYRHFMLCGPISEGGIGWTHAPGDYVRMAWLSAVAGRWADAETSLVRAIRSDARHDGRASEETVNALATVMDRRGAKTPEIAGSYRALVREFPRVVEPRIALAHVELALQQPAEATADALAAIAERPVDPAVVLPCANVLMQSGHAADADAALRRAIEADPKNAHLAAALGVALAVQNRPEDAVKQLAHAVDLEPGNPEPMAQIAQLLAEMGRPDEAAQWQKRAMQAAGASGGVR
jgi:Flp pilus assembly protein TadD